MGLGVLPRSLALLGAAQSRPSGGGHALACRLAWWRLGLPARDELTVGNIGLVGEGSFAPADLRARVGGGLALLPTPWWQAGAEFQGAELLVGQ